jgi:hypothetical protein
VALLGAESAPPESALRESALVVSAFVESAAESVAAPGGLLRGIRIACGTQSFGSVSQSCTVVSDSPAWAVPACALPHAMRPTLRNAATVVDRHIRIGAEELSMTF